MIKNAIWIFVVTVFILVFFLPSFVKMQELRNKNVQYQKQIEDLKRKNNELAIEKQKLEQDPVYLEKVAREKMGLVKEGEMIYRMTPVSAEQQKKKK